MTKSRQARWFRCPAHGCAWKLNADFFEYCQLASQTQEHIRKRHPQLKNWVGWRIRLKNIK